jgi:hypothetical protein
MNKKGISDVLTIGVMTFVIAIMLVVMYMSITPMLSGLGNVSEFKNNTLASASLQSGQDVMDKLDWIFLFIFISFVIVAMILSWFVAAIPIFMFIYFMALIIITVTMAVLSFSWSTMASAAPLLTTIQLHFPITNNIMENFTIYMMVIGFMSLIVMYAKPQQ